MNCKGCFPFRIGCTSYVIADEIVPNVRYMADTVDDIELVLFESGEFSNLPDKSVFSTLAEIADDKQLSYSVHLPIDNKVAAESYGERKYFIDTVLRIVELTSKLQVSGYIVHLEGMKDPDSRSDFSRWHSHAAHFCDTLSSVHDGPMSLFSIENLSYDPLLNDDIISRYGFSYCIDIGHLWLQNARWKEYLTDRIDATRSFHLHGVNCKGQDHVSLADHRSASDITELMPLLQRYSGVVTLEVFNEQDTFQSLSLVKELWEK